MNRGLYIGKYPPPREVKKISVNGIWGKKYEKGQRKRLQMLKKRRKRERQEERGKKKRENGKLGGKINGK
jgi:hypothetical protein